MKAITLTAELVVYSLKSYIYYKEYGVPVKIARLAQTFGYGVDPNDSSFEE